MMIDHELMKTAIDIAVAELYDRAESVDDFNAAYAVAVVDASNKEWERQTGKTIGRGFASEALQERLDKGREEIARKIN